MTLPRRLTLLSKDEIGIEPAGDIESLRYEHQHVNAMTLPANEEVVLEGISGSAMELELEIDTKSAPMVELNVLRSPQKEEFTRIAFFRERGMRNLNSDVNVRDSFADDRFIVFVHCIRCPFTRP